MLQRRWQGPVLRCPSVARSCVVRLVISSRQRVRILVTYGALKCLQSTPRVWVVRPVFLIVYMSYSSLLKSLWVVHALILVACWIYVLTNTYTPAFSLQAPPLPPCHITTGILSQCHAHVDVDKMHVLTNSKGVYIRNMYEYYLCSS